jgi:hypothetical protein
MIREAKRTPLPGARRLTEEQGRDHDGGNQAEGGDEHDQVDRRVMAQTASHGELLHPLRVKQNVHATDLFILRP